MVEVHFHIFSLLSIFIFVASGHSGESSEEETPLSRLRARVHENFVKQCAASCGCDDSDDCGTEHDSDELDPDGKENGSQDRDSSGMTNQIRNAFLNMHNTLRSKLARGVIKNGRNGKMFKKARRMPKLVYNRGLEKQASKRASECGYQFSIPDQLKESYRRVHPSERNEPKYRRNFARLAKDVVKGWWNEIYNLPNGIDETQNVNPYRLHITSFAKIASDLTTEVGCGFSRCKYSTIVICSYKTKVDDAKKLYDVGPTCEMCPRGRRSCENGLCL